MEAAFTFNSPKEETLQTALRILGAVSAHRRLPQGYASCRDGSCASCLSHHLPKIMRSVGARQPVIFVLPAFPGKSPNPAKVLGPAPDLAEVLSLQFLSGLSQSIERHYSPGIKMLLCSDGRVFSDVVGMKESDVTAYQNALDRLIEDMALPGLSTFNLDDHFGAFSFTQMREKLMERYGSPPEQLRRKIRNGAEATGALEEQDANRMYRGITRFLFEDSLFPGQSKTKTALQAEARAKAYEVIRRSNAWSELIAERFPDSVRLSIHPQICGSPKLGIRLVASESWMTPWHGVAVETQDGFVLMKRAQAEALGAELVYRNGIPSHFKL